MLSATVVGGVELEDAALEEVSAAPPKLDSEERARIAAMLTYCENLRRLLQDATPASNSPGGCVKEGRHALEKKERSRRKAMVGGWGEGGGVIIISGLGKVAGAWIMDGRANATWSERKSETAEKSDQQQRRPVLLLAPSGKDAKQKTDKSRQR